MSLWQTHAWQDMLLASWQIEKKLSINFMQREIFIEKRSLWLGQYGLFVIGLEAEVSKDCALELKKIAKQEKCLFAQIETLSYQFSSQNPPSWEKAYKKFIPPYTVALDLALSQDDLLAHMKAKGRYNIRLAEKKWVTLCEAKISSENIEKFYSLMRETTQRDGFSWNTQRYYHAFCKILPGIKLLFAEHEGDLLAAWIFVFQKDVSYYYYGASSNKKRNLMAPYLLQWEAIKRAKDEGSRYYDFLWVAPPGSQNDPLSGVTDFKHKFSPCSRYVSGAILYNVSGVKYMFFSALKSFRH